MTSMPASRSARTSTFAPRSCPSSPGLATRTRMRCWSAISLILPGDSDIYLAAIRMIRIGIDAPRDDAPRLEADDRGVASLAERLAALVQRFRAPAHLDAAHQPRLRLHIVHNEGDEPVAPDIAQLLAPPHPESADVDRVEVGV